MSQLFPLCLGLLCCAVFLQLLSVAIPYWVSGNGSHAGLWQACARVAGETRCASVQNKEGYFQALQSLEVLGLLAGIFGIVTILVSTFTTLLNARLARLLTAVHCIASGSIILMGIIEWTTKALGTSACFAMSIISAFGCGIIGGRLTVSGPD